MVLIWGKGQSDERMILFKACQDERLSVLPEFLFDSVSSEIPSFFNTQKLNTPAEDTYFDDSSLKMLANVASSL